SFASTTNRRWISVESGIPMDKVLAHSAVWYGAWMSSGRSSRRRTKTRRILHRQSGSFRLSECREGHTPGCAGLRDRRGRRGGFSVVCLLSCWTLHAVAESARPDAAEQLHVAEGYAVAVPGVDADRCADNR